MLSVNPEPPRRTGEARLWKVFDYEKNACWLFYPIEKESEMKYIYVVSYNVNNVIHHNIYFHYWQDHSLPLFQWFPG